MSLPEIVVERVPANAVTGSARRSQRQATALIFLVFVVAVALLPLLFYTFWVLLEALVRTAHLPRGTSLLGRAFPEGFAGLSGWPFDGAFLLSTLAVWGMLYLAYDRFALYGTPALSAALRSRAALLPGGVLPPDSFFVEIRPVTEERRLRDRWRPDIGWLVIGPDSLCFLGEETEASVPRACVRRARILGGHLGMTAAWVQLSLDGATGRDDLRILVRDDASRLSDTRRGAERLLAALRAR